MNDVETPQSHVPDPHIVEEYRALVAGEFADGALGRILLVVSTDDLTLSRGDLYVALGLAKYLRRLGWGISLWPTERWTEESPAGFDTAIVMIETFVPGLVHPETSAIAWVRNWTERWASLPYLDAYSQIWTSSQASADRLREVYAGPIELVPLATDHELFSPVDVDRDGGIVTTANFWGVNRDVMPALRALAETESITWYGKNARFLELPDNIDHRHTLEYFSLPWAYSSWRFVVDDVIEAASVYGNHNSRLFDALASGGLVVTNTRNGLDELGLQSVPVYDDAASLPRLIRDLRFDEGATAELTVALREIVLQRHTYERRAAVVSEFLQRPRAVRFDRSQLLAWVTQLREAYRTEEYEHSRLRTAYHDQQALLENAQDWIFQLETEVAELKEGGLRRKLREWRHPGSPVPGSPPPRA